MRPLLTRHNRPWLVDAACCLLALTGTASAQTDRRVTKLADGVYEIQHRDALDGFAGGNTTVIIGARQVFVVDAPFLPSESREDIAQIRRWTDRPVSFLLTTHFHNDHNLGNRAYLDAFPALTIIAQVEAKADMDRFGPGSRSREERGAAAYQRMLDRGTNGDGTALTEADKAELKGILRRRHEVLDELASVTFQSATMTFDHNLTIDLGDREVQVMFLGRGNTPGDAVAYLPKERIALVGDLVVHPMPYFYDGYPSEWIHTLERLAELDLGAIVPGHGPVLQDRTHLYLIRDLLKSATAQVNEALRASGPAMFRTVDDIKGRVDLTAFRARFAGTDTALGTAFDAMVADLINLVFREASLR